MQQTPEQIASPSVERRQFLKLAAVTGGLMAAEGSQGLLPRAAAQDASQIQLANPAFRQLYAEQRGYYIQNPAWVRDTVARLTWPAAGTKVPELGVLIPTTQPAWLNAFRKWSRDGGQVGLRYTMQQVSQSRWLEAIVTHMHGDIQFHPAVARPERVDPSEWLISRAYGKDRRNYGEWANEEYDSLIDLQSAESDPAKRLEQVRAAQKVLAEDRYITQLGWGPGVIDPYNAERWEGVVPVTGFGICSFDMFQTYLGLKPRRANQRRRVVVGTLSLVETLNIIQAANRFRSIGRMIYDRLAYLDKDLKVIPWAAERWVRLDELTYDVTLRAGMKFHDDRPVTVHDLKFTLDFLTRYDRGFFWTANQYLASTEILSEGNRTVRLRFKQPYGQFETYFLLLNVIFPKHLWENILQEQNVGDDPRALRFERPIGSGPFAIGRYQADTQMQLIARKDHFSRPSVDEIQVVVVPSTDGLLGRLQGGDLDFAEGVDFMPSQIATLQRERHIKVERTTDINWMHAVKRISWLPWRDVEFRRAWSHTIDREFLVRVVWEGSGRVPSADTFLVDGNPWTNPDLPAPAGFDLAKAREILGDAGYSWAPDDQRLVYPRPDDARWRERVERVCVPGYTWGGLKMIGS